MNDPTCNDYAQELGEWANCPVPDCPNKCCLHLNSPLCWPHTVGQPFNCHDGMTQAEVKVFNARVEYEWSMRRGAN